jgi:hypothetical protein
LVELKTFQTNVIKKIKTHVLCSVTAIGDTLRDLHLEDGKGTISHVNEYTYLGVRITKGGNCEPEINEDQ